MTADLTASAAQDRQFVSALARGLEVLGCFTPEDRFLSNQEIARRTGLPRPTISRLAHTLTLLGYLEHSADTGQYRLGTAVLSLGYAMLSNLDLREAARPFMQKFACRVGANVSLGVRDRLNVVYVERCQSDAPVTLSLGVGSRLPLATTSMGRAYLAALPEAQRTAIMAEIAADDAAAWPETRAGIEEELDRFAATGFCRSYGAWHGEVNAVSVPLRSFDGTTIMGLNCAGPAFQISAERLETELGPQLAELAREIEAALGRGRQTTTAGAAPALQGRTL